MEYKFKKGDRVAALQENNSRQVKKGWIGTVDENNDHDPYVNWDNGGRFPIDEDKLQLYKPTPQVKIAVSFENDSEKVSYLRYCESLGKVWCNGRKPTEDTFVNENDCIVFDNFKGDKQNEIGYATEKFYISHGYSIVPFKVFAALKGIDYTPIVEVKLNDDYTATIENGKVKVGCQTFEFDRIEALYNAVKEVRK